MKKEKTRLKLKKNFDDLVKAFKEHNFKVSVSEDNFARINSTRIFAGFCTHPSDFNTYLIDWVAIDRHDCFDKWSKCSIKLPIPRNDKQRRYLFEKINWLLTKDGFKFSDSYGCISEYWQ